MKFKVKPIIIDFVAIIIGFILEILSFMEPKVDILRLIYESSRRERANGIK